MRICIHLSFGHCPQCLDDRELDIHIGSIVQELHHLLHHPRRGLLELGMFLGEEEHLVVEEGPVTSVLADGNDGNQKTGCSGEIRSLSRKKPWSVRDGDWRWSRESHLSCLLLQAQQLIDRTLNISLSAQNQYW